MQYSVHTGQEPGKWDKLTFEKNSRSVHNSPQGLEAYFNAVSETEGTPLPLHPFPLQAYRLDARNNIVDDPELGAEDCAGILTIR